MRRIVQEKWYRQNEIEVCEKREWKCRKKEKKTCVRKERKNESILGAGKGAENWKKGKRV